MAVLVARMGEVQASLIFQAAESKFSLTCIGRRPQNMLERSEGFAD
jgi:hypothetical protein